MEHSSETEVYFLALEIRATKAASVNKPQDPALILLALFNKGITLSPFLPIYFTLEVKVLTAEKNCRDTINKSSYSKGKQMVEKLCVMSF